MTLLNLIKEDESFEYISLKEAISLLAEKTNSNIQEVAIYLLNKDVPSELVCNTKGTDYKIKETSGKQFSYGMFRAYGKNWAFEYLTNISEIHDCSSFNELTGYSVGIWDDWGLAVKNGNVGLLEHTYWYRQAFFNLQPIKSLNLLDDDQIESNQSLIPIWDANYLNIQELETQSHIELLDDLKLIDETFLIEVTPPFLMEELPRKNQPINDYKILLFKKPLLSGWDAASIIADIDPLLLCDLNEYEAGKQYPTWMSALNFIESSIEAGLLDRDDYSTNNIKRDNLKKFLLSQDIIINGFNDLHSHNPVKNISKIQNDNLQKRIEQLERDLNQERLQSFLLSEDYQSSQSKIEQLNARIKELENEKMQFQHSENAIFYQDILLENSDLILISVLLKMLQDEIKIKSHKSQARILQKIEDSHSHIKGLSKSRTEKLMGKANRIYKQLNNKEMQ